MTGGLSEAAPARPAAVTLMKFPYPYHAAVTVASDIDNASYNRFTAVHALFCGSEVILPGSRDWQTLGLSTSSAWYDGAAGGVRGLGLDLADSFWLIGDNIGMGMYRYDPAADRFNEDMSDGRNVCEATRGWLKSGQVDAFHTFLHYPREKVLPLLTEFYRWCEGEGVEKPRVWINHSLAVSPTGLCPDRFRPNRAVMLARKVARYLIGPLLGRDRQPLRYAFAWYDGDTPGSPYYLNDILAANGLRYVWLNLGLGRDAHCNRIALPERDWKGRPSVLDVVKMDDGVQYFRFDRCFGRESPAPGAWMGLRQAKKVFDTSVLFSRANLDRLCAESGTCILATHWTMEPSLPIQDETIAHFHLLRQYRDAGRVWVAPLGRLLEWTRVRTFLQYTVREGGGRLRIDIEDVNDPVLGRRRVTPEQCRGLAFRVPEAAAVEISAAGRPLSPEGVGRSGRDCWIR